MTWITNNILKSAGHLSYTHDIANVSLKPSWGGCKQQYQMTKTRWLGMTQNCVQEVITDHHDLHLIVLQMVIPNPHINKHWRSRIAPRDAPLTLLNYANEWFTYMFKLRAEY
jgi:hypothetical protein